MSFLDDLSKSTSKGNYEPLRKFLRKRDQVVKHDKYDAEAYQTVLREAQELQKIGEVGKVATEGFPRLLADAYFSLFKADPKLEKVDDIATSSLLHHAVMDKGMSIQEWEELRTFCVLDEWSAAMATINFADPLEQILREQKELFDQVQDMAGNEQGLRDLLDQMDGLIEAMNGSGPGQPGGEGSPQQQKEMEALNKAIQDALNQLLRGRDDLKKELKDKANELRKAMRNAMKQTLSDMKNESDMADAWGSEPGALTRMSYQERMDLARRVRKSPKLKKLAPLVGRVKRLAMGEQTKKIIHGRDEVHDVELGNDLSRVLPTQFLDLMDEDREVLFMKNFLEGSLLQTEMRGTVKLGKGPIIVVMDQSGSMGCSDGDGITREMWAKANALALLDIAKTQGRNFYGINFSHVKSDMMEFQFDKGAASLEQVLDYAEFFINGGTDFEHPLSRALEIIADERLKGYEKADIVFITDGACAVSPEWLLNYNEKRKEHDIRVFGIFVAGPRYEYDSGGWQDIMSVLCDSVFSIEDMTGAEDARFLYNSV